MGGRGERKINREVRWEKGGREREREGRKEEGEKEKVKVYGKVNGMNTATTPFLSLPLPPPVRGTTCLQPSQIWLHTQSQVSIIVVHAYCYIAGI